jgi:hypothetical protein
MVSFGKFHSFVASYLRKILKILFKDSREKIYNFVVYFMRKILPFCSKVLAENFTILNVDVS